MRWGRIPYAPTFDPPIDHLSFATKRKMKKNRLHYQSLIPHKATLQEFSIKNILVCLSWLSPLHVSKWPNTKCHYQLLPFGMENHRKMHSFTMWSFAVFFFGQIDYKAVSDACNVYKVYPDMIDSWLSLHDVVKYFGDNYRDFQNYSKPGSFMMTSQVRLSSLLYQHRCTFSNFHHFKSSQWSKE